MEDNIMNEAIMEFLGQRLIKVNLNTEGGNKKFIDDDEYTSIELEMEDGQKIFITGRVGVIYWINPKNRQTLL